LRCASASLLVLAFALVAVPAFAVAPPAELDLVCVDAQDDVLFVAAASDCGSRETVVALPAATPVHWCADHLGRLTAAPASGQCGSHGTALTVPDDGPIFVCARIVQGGSLLTRGDLRTVPDVSQCDPHEVGMVTPAAPEGVSDTYTIDEDTLLVVPAKGVLDNDRDLTGGPLTAHLVSSTASGVLDLAADGSFTFDPRGAFDRLDQGESASTSFSYVADDGALTSDPTTVTLVVTGRNDRPVAHDDELTVDEDSVLRLTAPGLLANDTDAESQALTTELVSGPDKGTLTLAPDGGLTFDPRAAFQSLGAEPGDDGSTTFRYVAKDGTTTSDEATVTVHVTGVDDAPVGAPDTFATDENTPLVIAPADLLGNDKDAEGSALSVSNVQFPTPGNGALTTLADGSLRFDPTVDSADADGTPDFDHLTSGQDATVELTYRADDGVLQSDPVTVRIVVHGISAPTANDDVTGTDEDHPVSLDVLGNDQLEGGTLTLDRTGTHGSVTVEHDGVVRYDPRGAFDQLGARDSDTDTFHYTLSNDEGSSTGEVTVVVSGVNDAPVALDDGYLVEAGTPLDVAGTPCGDEICGVLSNDWDVDTPAADLVAELVSPPGLGRLTLRPDGGFTFDPADDFTGTTDESTTFSYHADDGAAESPTATVTLTVGSNLPPTFVGDPYDFTVVTTDASGTEVGTVTASDADGDALTYSVLTADTAAFAIDSATGQLTVGPDGAPGPGTYQLTVRVDDGSGGSDQAFVTVHVVPELNAVDDSFTALGNTELVGGAPPAGSFTARASVRVAGLLANDGGTSGSVVVQSDAPTSAGGRVTVGDDGSFVYTPPVADATDPTAWDGSAPITDTFEYQLAGGAGVSDPTGQVTITVQPPVWYVDNAATGPGTGTAWDPYASLAGVSGDAADRDLPDQTVFLFGHADDPTTTSLDESVYPGGITLEDGQHLVGQGAGLTVAGSPVVSPGPAPRVDGTTTASAVGLAEDNHLTGFVVGGPGAGIHGDAVGALHAQLTSVASDGPALALSAGSATGAPDVHIDQVTSGSGGIALDGLSGTVALTNATLGDTSRITVSGETGQVDVDTADLGAGGATVSDTSSSGTVRFGSLTGSGAAGGIALAANDGTVVVEDIALTGLHGAGIAVQDESGTVQVGDGTVTGDSENMLGALLSVSGTTTGSVTIGADLALQPADGHLDTRTGHSVDVTGVGASGVVRVTGHILDRGLGVRTTSSPGTIGFSGGMDLATGSSTAFDGSDVGTLEVVSPGSASPVKLVSTTATTLHLVGVGVGAAGARFNQVDGLPGTSSTAPDYAIDLDSVHAAGGPGLVVNDGTVQLPAVAGARIQSSSDITLRGLLVDTSSGDGVELADVHAVTLDGVQVSQADAIGITAVRSGDVHLLSTTVSASGGSGVTLRDLEGAVYLTGSQISDARGIPLVVTDGTASTTAQDAVVLDSTVVSGGAEENDSIAVTAGDDDPSAPGAADLEFRVGGSSPSGSIGGNIGLDARATDGAALYVGLQKLAVADTASDGIRLGATGTGTALDFDLATMDSTGGGGIQLAGGAGIRAVGDGTATIGGTMDQVKVVTTVDSGVVLDRVAGVSMDLVSVASTPSDGIEIDRSQSVSIGQADVSHVKKHGLAVTLGTDITVDNSRFDLRPAPAKVGGQAPDFSAIWMRHLGGSANAVTDTTLRGSTGDQLMILEGTSVSALPGEGTAPADAPTTATVKVSGLTTVDTAIDYDTTDSVVPDGNAVTALAGSGADLTVDLDGSASRTDETVALGAEAGGSLTVVGGHAIDHQSVDTAAERSSSDADPTVAVTSTGAGSQVRLGIDGLALTQSASSASGAQPPGNALVVTSSAGGSVVPVAGGPSLRDSSVVSLGNADAVHLVADLPGSGPSTFDVQTSGLDVGFAIPDGVTSTADAVSAVGLNGGVVDNLGLAGGQLTAAGGHALRLYTLGTPGSIFPPVPPLPEGAISSVTVDGVTVAAGAGDAITGSGQLGSVVVRNATVSGGTGSGIALSDASCVDLSGNDTSAVGSGEFGYVLTGVGLKDYVSGAVADWLTDKGNVGPAAPWFVDAAGNGGC
jgi:VCBS repeat-containing protein